MERSKRRAGGPLARRRISSGSCVLLALALALAGPAIAGTEIGEVSGDVEVGRGVPAIWQPAVTGSALSPGDAVRTGSDGRTEVHLPAGTVRLYENSLLRIPSGQPNGEAVELERGSSIFDILRRQLGSRFEVETPEVVVSVKGTRFTVDLSRDIPSVAVFRGTVGVRSAGTDLALETLVREGFAATGGGGRPFELELAPELDPWRGWEAADRLPDLTTHRLEEMLPTHVTDEARATALETTSAEVVERAAARNPEIAEKLEKIRARRQHGQGDEDASLTPPAAPAPGERDLHGDLHGELHGELHEEKNLRPTVRRLLREHEETHLQPGAMAEQRHPKVPPGQMQQILTEVAPTLPGGGVSIDYTELMATYQGFIASLYEQHAQELAASGVEAYRDLLSAALVDRGVSIDDAKNLADKIVDVLH